MKPKLQLNSRTPYHETHYLFDPGSELFQTQYTCSAGNLCYRQTHTYPRFSYSHFGFSTQLSRFDKTSGNIVIDREAKIGSVSVTIDTTSVDTGYPLFNEHIQGADFLDTAKYPTANFTSSKVNFEGDKVS